MPRFVAALALSCLTAATSSFALAQVTAMPSRAAPPSIRPDIPVKSLNVPSARVDVNLSPPGAAERYEAGLAIANNVVGFGRAVSPNGAEFDAGGRVLFRITSPTATSLRARLSLTPGSYRLYAWADGDSIATITDAVSSETETSVWSGMTEGATQNLLIERHGDGAAAYAAVNMISHLYKTPGKTSGQSLAKDFGDAAPCQLDAMCLAPFVTQDQADQIVIAGNSSPLLVITEDDGETASCSGTLLNSKSYPAPILLTANHCIKSAHNLSNLLTLWFAVRTGCGVGPANPGIQVTGGALALWRSDALDGALLQLSQTPPPLAGYAGWDAGVALPGAPMIALHHPQADLLKGSFGTVLGENTTTQVISGIAYPAGTFYAVGWQLGFSEPGSSGSALFTYSTTLNSLVVQGTLTGGAPASCASSNNLTWYSELNNQYPYIVQYLSGAAPPPPPPPPGAGKVQVVEYYNAGLNHYFITSNATEISLLGKPPFDAWQPTGLAFNAYSATNPPSGTAGVCRFFNDHFLGISTHFYAPHGLGCEQVLSGFPDWTLEDANLFYANLPDATTGACPAGQIPVYRLFNNGMGGAPNHRFTTDASVRAQMLAKGYTPEGYGIGVGWCAPN